MEWRERGAAPASGSWDSGFCALGLGVAAQSAQTGSADPQITFRIIVVSSAERAAQLAVRGRQGEDFGALARAESLDPSAAQGGLIGPIALSALRAELRDALRDLLPGEIRGVLTIATGFALVQRLETEPVASARGREYPQRVCVSQCEGDDQC